MRRQHSTLLALGMLVISQIVYAQPPAVQQYTQKVLEEFYTCRLRATLELLQRDAAMTGTRACIVQAKAILAPLYGAARATLMHVPAALALLNDFYAAWLGGLDALFPAPGEREQAYHGRVSAMQNRLTEMRHRLEIEAQ